MLDIGKTNLFLSDKGGSIISRIIDDYDLIGHNCLFLEIKPTSHNIYTKCNTIGYSSYDKIPSILEDNLFRVYIIIVEMSINYKYLLNTIREITDLPIILINDFGELSHSENDFDYIYKFYREERNGFTLNLDMMERIFLENSHIVDIKNDWDMSLGDLRTQYIRDKKINDLLK
jgi:hypothetical protein